MTQEQAIKNTRKWLEDYSRHTSQHDVLDDVDDSFIVRVAEDSVNAKEPLRNVFRKSPAWNEELDAIVINGTRTHNPDPETIQRLYWNILDPLWDAHPEKRMALQGALYLFDTKNPSEDTLRLAVNSIAKLAPKAYAPNKKLSRVFRDMCRELGVADETAGSQFQRLYAQFADELSAKQIDFKLIVSLNVAHFLSMSNPKGDERGSTLTSCHSFNSTEYTYNCGCSGYARDSVSFIVFTVDDFNNAESLNNRKTTRQIFAYRPGSGLLLQSRMYNTSGGTRGACEDCKLYRDLVQREISFCEDKPNLWETHHSYDAEYSSYVRPGYGFGGYCDWQYNDFDCHISFRADCDRENVEPLRVGTYGLCVACGEEISEGMYCDDCNGGSYTCDACGCRCPDTFPVYTPRGREIYVCERCRDEDYTWCERCDNYYANECMTEVDGNYLCDDCRNEVAERCEVCGEWHYRDDMHYAEAPDGNGVWACDDCIDRYEHCPHCREYYTELDSDGCCPACGALVEEHENEEEVG